jgi:serine/threonine-protein kinase
MSDETLPPESAAGAAADLTGKVLSGDFAILRRIGQGGMGQVYLAEQMSLKRKVALKVLKPELSANELSMKRFQAEAHAVARATHANIVQVYAIGIDGVHYMALEYVDGFNLRDYIVKKGPPELPQALSIMRQVGNALARAAELGIVHRDIKPENILLTRKGEVKVADFGLSRCFGDDQQPLNITQSGVAMGTPLYMSPEQVQGKPVDPRTDIYSFGVTCYHMLSGQPPFRGNSPFEVAVQHVQTHPSPLNTIRPDLPADLCALVDRMMAKAPEERFQSARDMLRELSRIRDSLSTTAPVVGSATAAVPTAPGEKTLTPSRAKRKRRWPVVLFAAGILVGLLAGAAVGWKRSRLASASGTPAQSDEERHLRHEAKTDPAAAVHLLLYLLDRGRLDDANVFSNHLIKEPGALPEMHALGGLGEAIVLAQHDKPRESNEAFLEAKKLLDSQPGRGAALLQPRLRLAISRSLERNTLNGEAANVPFPAELASWRRSDAGKKE